MNALLPILSVAGIAVTIYTHWRLGDFVRGAGRTLALRLFLVLLGIGVGSAAIINVPCRFRPRAPAAIVLMLKRLRGEGRR
jgi:hypothetical protein